MTLCYPPQKKNLPKTSSLIQVRERNSYFRREATGSAFYIRLTFSSENKGVVEGRPKPRFAVEWTLFMEQNFPLPVAFTRYFHPISSSLFLSSLLFFPERERLINFQFQGRRHNFLLLLVQVELLCNFHYPQNHHHIKF